MDNRGTVSITYHSTSLRPKHPSPYSLGLRFTINGHVPIRTYLPATTKACGTNKIRPISEQRRRLACDAGHDVRLLSRFSSCSFREGSFVMVLTDLHQSNIFVDGN